MIAESLLPIYQTAIFNVTTDPAQISNAQTLTIECWGDADTIPR